ncbi:oligoendopeptidase F [[Clostridium] sordellii]|uniref:Oligopeptidase F n=1 Tax=Paraclostridium sordellii TaxID=1505 RepID=A0ABM9RK54_PARSO|nr:oligoendopeptidase F [Paeniclostridium sordellii]CEJ72344.1 putative oligoendopeptidase F, M3B family [[Clostridium] sordellii] [Paeniclostridium sordellii]CEN70570.1 oligoendopeptidase F [[Clostridium] sordellii] [Paeniclostridium sordellii]CEN73933.1 oligoendopeptidase F [[Clostridium] sordellii] [Paeniclostridium sordellii]CEO28431.1 oligoendopeptidase F [[Clostridium] sordellii] [Paeniclostridium sordellii]CEP77222.1 oligoendopeptidase F [[Clostridium] sordellii] [Paeniclostridium sorde
MGVDRTSIEDKFKWNIDTMYQSNESIKDDIDKVNSIIEELKSYKGKISSSKENLYKVLSNSEKASRILQNLYVYTHMKQHEDTRNNENQARATKAEMLSTELSMATSYIVPEIIAMDENKLKEYLEDEKLSFYKKYVDEILRDKPHTLTEKEEEILAGVSDLSTVPENVYEMFSFADLKFPEIKGEDGKDIRITHGNYSTFLKSKDSRVRKDAFEAVYSTYEDYKNTFASTLYGGIKSEIFYSKMRNYKSAIESSLFQDDISVGVYYNLISAVDENLDTLNRYVDIRKKYLNIDEMHMYDLYVPITSNFDMKITYEEAQDIILKALKPLGEEYLSIVKRAFNERWIDVYENEGKQGGAYSWGSYDSSPYILMSYKDDLNSLFTLIHELGHSMHSYYSKHNQEYLYSSYKIFVAEVASTLNELLLVNYLLENSSSKEERIYLLNYYLEQFRTTVYRQTMFAEFEKITHERVEAGEPLTAKEFTDIYYDLNKKYYGKSCIVDEEIGLEWARIPHFYSNFYVYKYATGFSAASALSEKILNEGKSAVEKYIEFLKSGGSDYPLNQLRAAGVDMEKKESIEKALDVFKELVEELEREC